MTYKGLNNREAWDEYVRSIFLDYITKHPEVNQLTCFPAYFQRELNISDSYTYLKKLLKQGYLTRKSENVLAVSAKGKRAIMDEYIRFFEVSTPYVTFSEYTSEKIRMEGQESVEVTMLSVLLKKIKPLQKANNYVGVKDVHLDVAGLYEQVGATDRAMYHYLISLYYDVSGLEYYDELLMYSKGKHKRAQSEQAFYGICIRPQVMKGIFRLKEAYNPQMVHEIFEKEQISINLCTESRMQELIEDLRNDAYDYSAWRKYFEKNYRSMLQVCEKYRKKEAE